MFFESEIAVWPGSKQFEKREIKIIPENTVNESEIFLNSHTGTHFDAPRHFIKNGKSLSDYTIDRFAGEALVVEYNGQDEIPASFFQEIDLNTCKKILIKTPLIGSIDHSGTS